MFPNLLFTMSLSGSVVFILYILTYVLFKKYFSLKCKYIILKIAAAFYLLPIPLYKYLIIDIIRCFIPALCKKVTLGAGIINMKYLIIIGNGLVQFSSNFQNILLVMLFVGTVSFVIIQKHIIQYRRWKTIYGVNSIKPTNCEQELFKKIKKEIGIKRDIKLIYSEYCQSPMTSGILSPTLILPICENKLKTAEYEYILRHELIHIKHHDLLIKYIGLLVMAVHWYNPLVYIMFFETSVISEMYCDNIVISGKSDDERKKYSNLILQFATQDEYTTKNKFFAGIANNKSKKVYKRRILEMKIHKKYKTILSCIIMVFLCMAGGVTTLAYNSPNVMSTPLEINLNGDEDNYFITDSAYEEQRNLQLGYFFADDNGNIYDISNSNISNRNICVHDFSIHGTYNKHEKDKHNGCVVKVYEALLCSKCSDVKTIKLKSTGTYSPCPH